MQSASFTFCGFVILEELTKSRKAKQTHRTIMAPSEHFCTCIIWLPSVCVSASSVLATNPRSLYVCTVRQKVRVFSLKQQ